MVTTVMIKWEGVPHIMRNRVTRSSAAGGALADSYAEVHAMAGYDGAMRPVAECGIALRDDYLLRPATASIGHLCERCFA